MTSQINKNGSMKNKTVLITGADGSIGSEISLGLAKLDARIIMAVINVDAANNLKDRIIAETSNNKIIVHYVDLSSQTSIRELSAKIHETETRLDVLIHNAGVAFDHTRVKSTDNIDMTMAVNYYAQFLLTHLLIDLLKRSAPARIVSVASGSHIFSSSNINYNPTSRWRYPGYTYMQSKVAIVYFTQELARRLSGSGVTVNCLCPGLIYTGIHQNLCCPLRLLLRSCRTCMPSPADGAKTSIFLASSKIVDQVSGHNFVKCDIKGLQQRFKNKDKHVDLWEASRKIVQLTENDPSI